ncbi:MAG: hypothetical protein J2P27_18600 [Actinobacteria bacterium]|nr:hypothetical protein [Actinomycetota bacterium]
MGDHRPALTGRAHLPHDVTQVEADVRADRELAGRDPQHSHTLIIPRRTAMAPATAQSRSHHPEPQGCQPPRARRQARAIDHLRADGDADLIWMIAARHEAHDAA